MAIDEDFKDKLEVTAKDETWGYDIWGEFNPPTKLGITDLELPLTSISV